MKDEQYLLVVESEGMQQDDGPYTFVEYLKNAALDGQFNLVSDGLINFHWANWSQTCHFQRQLLKKGTYKERLKKLGRLLNVLKEVDVYIRNQKTEMKISLYDLYEAFLDTRMRLIWFQGDHETLISMHQQAGPYTSVKSMRWFNKDIYALFIFKKILTQEMPTRKFRLGLNLPVYCQFDGSELNTASMVLHQITENGMILKVSGETNLSRIIGSSFLNLWIEPGPLVGSKGRKLDGIFDQIENYDFVSGQPEGFSLKIPTGILQKYGNLDNIRSSNASEFFIYCCYEDLFSENDRLEHREMRRSLVELVESVRQSFEKHLKKSA